MYILEFLFAIFVLRRPQNHQGGNLGYFFKFFGNFSFFQTDPYSLKDTFGELCFNKNVRYIKRPTLPKIKVSKCFKNEIEPKTKKGELRMKKFGKNRSRVSRLKVDLI